MKSVPKDKKSNQHKVQQRRNAAVQVRPTLSIEKPTTTYLANLLAKTERAIKLLDGKVQNTYRILATNKLKQIFGSTNHQNLLQKKQL